MINFLRKYHLYIFGALICFLIGAYVWKVANTGQPTMSVGFGQSEYSPRASSVLVEIGDTKITTDDLNFEYSLHTRKIFVAADLTPIPDLGARYDEELSPLREGLLSAMIERKLLYEYLQEHTKFDLEDPKRFSACLDEWQRTIAEESVDIVSPGDKERLKQRLCEKAVLEQYLDETIYPTVTVSKEEIKEYYESHSHEFEKPSRVFIRQIVLPDERSAKKARHGLTRHNFASRAKELSITPEASKGGALGPFAKTDMPRVFDIAFSMRKGDIYGILKSTYGFHLIMLEKKLPAEKLSLADAAKTIEKKLIQKKKEKLFQEWIETALDTVEVKSPKPLW